MHYHSCKNLEKIILKVAFRKSGIEQICFSKFYITNFIDIDQTSLLTLK
jgi:hypothetical protein